MIDYNSTRNLLKVSCKNGTFNIKGSHLTMITEMIEDNKLVLSLINGEDITLLCYNREDYNRNLKTLVNIFRK